MKSSFVVKDLDILEDAHGRLDPGSVGVSINQLLFERPEEAFCDCIVPAISTTTHALDAIIKS